MRDDNRPGMAWKAARRFTIIAALVAVFLWLLLPGRPAAASPPCAPYEHMARFLADRFGETPRGIGLVDDKRVVQLFASVEGSWTILVTNTAGRACIMAAGEGWEAVAAPGGPSPGDPV